jgi:hypothetical protein
MGLDASVCCNCVREGKAKAHPIPEKLVFDDGGQPALNDGASNDDWIVHDRWLTKSCEHGGFLVSVRLGNISMIAHVRELLCDLQRTNLSCPLLLEKVVYNGIHSGDSIPSADVPLLQKEVDTVLRLSSTLDSTDREFFTSMGRLCEASIATGNPIVF